jgi:hypothetical protein
MGSAAPRFARHEQRQHATYERFLFYTLMGPGANTSIEWWAVFLNIDNSRANSLFCQSKNNNK